MKDERRLAKGRAARATEVVSVAGRMRRTKFDWVWGRRASTSRPMLHGEKIADYRRILTNHWRTGMYG